MSAEYLGCSYCHATEFRIKPNGTFACTNPECIGPASGTWQFCVQPRPGSELYPCLSVRCGSCGEMKELSDEAALVDLTDVPAWAQSHVCQPDDSPILTPHSPRSLLAGREDDKHDHHRARHAR